jgi:NAD(P)-dependent dehydrogenase (short-subunit alcohol dehydrogenase family)
MVQGRRVLKDEFKGLVAVVTGAAQGIGRAIAEELHAQGASLVLVDCNLEGVVETTEWLCKAGRAAVDFVVADLSDPLVIPILAAQVAALRPKIDVLVNNAGIEVDLPFMRLTAEVFDRVMAVNLRAPLLVSKELASLFPDSGGP